MTTKCVVNEQSVNATVKISRSPDIRIDLHFLKAANDVKGRTLALRLSKKALQGRRECTA
jgi:hypothetical protein